MKKENYKLVKARMEEASCEVLPDAIIFKISHKFYNDT